MDDLTLREQVQYKLHFSSEELVIFLMKMKAICNSKLFLILSISDATRHWFGLVWFNGISTIVGYLMPNPVFIYMICKHIL